MKKKYPCIKCKKEKDIVFFSYHNIGRNGKTTGVCDTCVQDVLNEYTDMMVSLNSLPSDIYSYCEEVSDVRDNSFGSDDIKEAVKEFEKSYDWECWKDSEKREIAFRTGVDWAKSKFRLNTDKIKSTQDEKPNNNYPSIKELDCIKITKINKPMDKIDDDTNTRLPKVGDEGAVVYVHSGNCIIMIECVGDDGAPVWLRSFEFGDIEFEKIGNKRG